MCYVVCTFFTAFPQILFIFACSWWLINDICTLTLQRDALSFVPIDGYIFKSFKNQKSRTSETPRPPMVEGSLISVNLPVKFPHL